MAKLYFFTFIVFCAVCNAAYAQPKKGEFIDLSVGLGLCAPYDQTDLTGSGFYAQAEYVWAPYSWFGIRPYAGMVIASGKTDKEVTPESRIKSNAALLGIKVRLAAPIPYFAPFIESGVGMSVGSFETFTPYVNHKKNGVLLHIPVILGVALGRNHNVDVKFIYYLHESIDQFSGAAAVGLSFPVN